MSEGLQHGAGWQAWAVKEDEEPKKAASVEAPGHRSGPRRAGAVIRRRCAPVDGRRRGEAVEPQERRLLADHRVGSGGETVTCDMRLISICSAMSAAEVGELFDRAFPGERD